MIPKYRAYINERVGIVSVKRICFYPPFIDFEWENEIGVMQTYSEDLDKVKLMQSTGLKDKNGQEIFEGDIIEHQHVGYQRGVVKMVDGCWVIDDKNEGVNFEELAFEVGAGMGIVIGNIYEHPGLLEVAE